MKKLAALKGIKKLSKKELKAVKGGFACIWPNMSCPGDTICDYRTLLCRKP